MPVRKALRPALVYLDFNFAVLDGFLFARVWARAHDAPRNLSTELLRPSALAKKF